MDTKEIFREVQAGKITIQEAYKKLSEFLDQSGYVSEEKSEETENSMNQESVVQVREIEPGIVQVSMQERKHKNTFSTELITGLIETFESLQNNKECKVVILTGYDTYFACGGTQEGMMAIYEGKAKMTDLHLFSMPIECNVPVIAAMQGHGLGGGLCLGLFCDFVIMSRESKYACNHMSYGFTPGDGATLILPRMLGAPLAQELLFTGKHFNGAELAKRGATLPILPRKDVLPYAIKLARELAEKPKDSLILLKQHMAKEVKKNLNEIVEREWEMQEKTLVDKPEVMEKILPAFNLNSNPASFPELLHLNQHFSGRPVFWIHGESGGIEGFQWVAEKSKRPFYGIQARGHMTEQTPIKGIEATAAYYVTMIQSKQPNGPYDLGGFSLGGLLAYEVTRQLQKAGQTVNSLVMLDSPDLSSWGRIKLSSKSRILQAVNMALLNRQWNKADEIFENLIHNNEMPDYTDEKSLLIQLIRMGRERGLSLTLSEDALLKLFQRQLRMQEAFELEQYTLYSLPKASEVTCYFIRNQNGLFYGELMPYLTTNETEITIDYTTYWEEWESIFSDFRLVDVSSTNHITLLFDSTAQSEIVSMCENLYE